jgi:hypothetical protein
MKEANLLWTMFSAALGSGGAALRTGLFAADWLSAGGGVIGGQAVAASEGIGGPSVADGLEELDATDDGAINAGAGGADGAKEDG